MHACASVRAYASLHACCLCACACAFAHGCANDCLHVCVACTSAPRCIEGQTGCGAGLGVSLGSCVSSTDGGVAEGGRRAGVVDRGLRTGGFGAGLQGQQNTGIDCGRNGEAC